MDKGWILDCHLDMESECMSLWVKKDQGGVQQILMPWSFTIHVHGESHRLDELGRALSRPEYQRPFGPLSLRKERHRISHEDSKKEELLAVSLQKPSKIRSIAEMIDANGSWRNFEIFSVDPKITQKFLLDLKTHPFGRVEISGDRILPLDTIDVFDWEIPPLRIIELDVCCMDVNGKRKASAPISSITIVDKGVINCESQSFSQTLVADAYTCSAHMLDDFHRRIEEINPDIVITHDGDNVDIPALIRLAEQSGMKLNIGRNGRESKTRSKERVNWSYGRILRKEAYHSLEGRLHIDMGRSFIAKEGGIEGLIELSRISGLPAADLSRLSPGSAISAMQIRQSIEDGVLIPWKKNRPEDMKDGKQIMLADRGGLYLDPIVGVHQGVIELDFASLFPSIIATRNISPETMNCKCCALEPNYPKKDGRLSLNVKIASAEIQRRKKNNENRRLFVPELGLHVCTKRHGFLGRVVAPIIERRNVLKEKRRIKGDVWDRRQNVLKWILVTCFGYTGYRNARFGRIECHEAICAWSREILLTTIEEANKEGWDCIHAIVDAIWIKDRMNRSDQEKRNSYQRLMDRVDALVGIPLELEHEYDWIAFIPNRTTGVGALTKYYAKIGEDWKVRGIELRQHSTCKWIRKLQKDMMEDLAEDPFGIGPVIAAQRVEDEISRMSRGEVPLNQLIVGRRVRYETGNHRVMNLTAGALLRAKELEQTAPPGRKIRFAVTGWKRVQPTDRVRLQSEIELGTNSISGEKGDAEFYTPLAVRAATSILSPFGWNEDDVAAGSKRQSSLEAWM